MKLHPLLRLYSTVCASLVVWLLLPACQKKAAETAVSQPVSVPEPVGRRVAATEAQGAPSLLGKSTPDPFAAVAMQNFLGRYRSDDNATCLHLRSSGEGMTGVLVFNGQTYEVTARLSGDGVAGEFGAGQDHWPFSLTSDGHHMRFRTGSEVQELSRRPMILNPGVYKAGSVWLVLKGASGVRTGLLRFNGQEYSFTGELAADEFIGAANSFSFRITDTGNSLEYDFTSGAFRQQLVAYTGVKMLTDATVPADYVDQAAVKEQERIVAEAKAAEEARIAAEKEKQDAIARELREAETFVQANLIKVLLPMKQNSSKLNRDDYLITHQRSIEAAGIENGELFMVEVHDFDGPHFESRHRTTWSCRLKDLDLSNTQFREDASREADLAGEGDREHLYRVWLACADNKEGISEREITTGRYHEDTGKSFRSKDELTRRSVWGIYLSPTPLSEQVWQKLQLLVQHETASR